MGGFALIALLGLVAAAAASSSRRGSGNGAPRPRTDLGAPRVNTAPPSLPPPDEDDEEDEYEDEDGDITPEPTPTEAAEAVHDGDPTSEDYEVLAREADNRGMTDASQRLREQAESAPTTEEVVQAEEAAEEQGATEDDEDPPANPQVPASTDPANPAPGFVPPSGFDPHLAVALSKTVSDDIWERKYSYNRNNLKRFQRAAGIAVDGVYGPGSRAALMYYLPPDANPAPNVLFKGSGGQKQDEVVYPEALRYWARRNGYNSATSGRSSRRARRRKKRRKRWKKFAKFAAFGPLGLAMKRKKKKKKGRGRSRQPTRVSTRRR